MSQDLDKLQAQLDALKAAHAAPAPTPAPQPAAPASDPRIDQLTASLGTLVDVVGKLAQPAPAAPAPTPPATAPSAPSPFSYGAPSGHSLPTQQGIVDLFSLTPAQIKELGPKGVRATLEQLNEIGRDMAGIPHRPKPPAQR